MEAAARMTSKGQVTVPKAVREASAFVMATRSCSGLRASRAVLARTAD